MWYLLDSYSNFSEYLYRLLKIKMPKLHLNIMLRIWSPLWRRLIYIHYCHEELTFRPPTNRTIRFFEWLFRYCIAWDRGSMPVIGDVTETVVAFQSSDGALYRTLFSFTYHSLASQKQLEYGTPPLIMHGKQQHHLLSDVFDGRTRPHTKRIHGGSVMLLTFSPISCAN